MNSNRPNRFGLRFCGSVALTAALLCLTACGPKPSASPAPAESPKTAPAPPASSMAAAVPTATPEAAPKAATPLDSALTDIATRWGALESLRVAFDAYVVRQPGGEAYEISQLVRGSGEMVKKEGKSLFYAALLVNESYLAADGSGAEAKPPVTLRAMIVCDGKSALEQITPNGASGEKASTSVRGKLGDPAFQFVPNFFPMDTPLSRVVGEGYTLTLEPEEKLLEHDVYVIKAQPKTPPATPGAFGDSARFYVDKSNGVPLKIVYFQEERKPLLTIVVTLFELNPNIDEMRFQIFQPEEASAAAAPSETTTLPPEVSGMIQISPPAMTTLPEPPMGPKRVGPPSETPAP